MKIIYVLKSIKEKERFNRINLRKIIIVQDDLVRNAYKVMSFYTYV